MIEGYNRKKYRESSEQRRAAFIIISPHTKDLPFEKFCKDFWPLQGDVDTRKEDERGNLTVDKDLWAKIQQEMNKGKAEDEKRKKEKEYERIIKEEGRKLSKQRRNKK